MLTAASLCSNVMFPEFIRMSRLNFLHHHNNKCKNHSSTLFLLAQRSSLLPKTRIEILLEEVKPLIPSAQFSTAGVMVPTKNRQPTAMLFQSRERKHCDACACVCVCIRSIPPQTWRRSCLSCCTKCCTTTGGISSRVLCWPACKKIRPRSLWRTKPSSPQPCRSAGPAVSQPERSGILGRWCWETVLHVMWCWILLNDVLRIASGSFSRSL